MKWGIILSKFGLTTYYHIQNVHKLIDWLFCKDCKSLDI
jgi:hypothetical protein